MELYKTDCMRETGSRRERYIGNIECGRQREGGEGYLEIEMKETYTERQTDIKKQRERRIRTHRERRRETKKGKERHRE